MFLFIDTIGKTLLLLVSKFKLLNYFAKFYKRLFYIYLLPLRYFNSRSWWVSDVFSFSISSNLFSIPRCFFCQIIDFFISSVGEVESYVVVIRHEFVWMWIIKLFSTFIGIYIVTLWFCVFFLLSCCSWFIEIEITDFWSLYAH